MSRRQIALIIVCVGPTIAGQRAMAQSTPGQSPEEVLRLPPVLRVAAPSFGSGECAVASAMDVTEGEVADLPFTDIRLARSLAVPAGELEQEWRDLRGRSLSRETLARLVTRIECVYRASGFVFARASLAEDAAAPGAYVLDIKEGRLGRVEAAADNPTAANFLLRAFADVRPGQPINASDVRKGLALAASYGFADVRPTIRRSRSDPDALDLILMADAPQTNFFLGAQNLNTKELGPWGALTGVTFHGATPLQERTTFGLYQSIDKEEQLSIQASTEALLTRSGLGARLDVAWSRARPGGELKPLDVDAVTAYGRLEFSHPVTIQQGLVVFAETGFEAIDQRTELIGDAELSNDNLRIVTAGVRADALKLGTAFSGALQVRKGLGGLGASQGRDTQVSRADANPQAVVVRARAEANRPIGPFQMRAQLRGQWTEDALFAFEEFSFGALTGGRGLDPSAIIGDHGFAGTLEMSAGPFRLPGQVRVQPYLFTDAGRVWNHDAFAASRADAVTGGAGLRIAQSGRAALDIVYASPLGRVTGAIGDVGGDRLLVQVSTNVNWPLGGAAGKRVRQ